jgi:hypothetical protein
VVSNKPSKFVHAEKSTETRSMQFEKT